MPIRTMAWAAIPNEGATTGTLRRSCAWWDTPRRRRGRRNGQANMLAPNPQAMTRADLKAGEEVARKCRAYTAKMLHRSCIRGRNQRRIKPASAGDAANERTNTHTHTQSSGRGMCRSVASATKISQHRVQMFLNLKIQIRGSGRFRNVK